MKVCDPKIQGPDSTLHLAHVASDCEFHYNLLTVDQSGTNFVLFN